VTRSGWTPFLIATVVFLVVVAWPVIAAVGVIVGEGPAESAGVELSSVVGRSAAWGAGVAAGAVILGWWPANLLAGRLGRRGFLPLATLCVLPACLPPYVLYWSWWQSWPTDSAIFRWAVEQGRVDLLREMTLAAAWLCWAWSIPALAAAASLASFRRDEQDMLRLDGAGASRRLVSRLRAGAPGVMLGFLIVFVFVFNNTTSFDLALVKTLGFELRVLDAEGAAPYEVLASSAPGIIIVIALLAGALLIPRKRERPENGQPARTPTSAILLAPVVFAVCVVAPFALIVVQAMAMDWTAAELVYFGYADAALNSTAAALAAAVAAVAIAIGLGSALADHRRWVRWFAGAQVIGWVLVAALPALVSVVAIESAFNRAAPFAWLRLDELVYTSPLVIVLSHLSRFGFAGALLGCWLAWRDARETRDLRRLDGAETLRGLWGVNRPRWLAVGITGSLIVAVLALGEVIASGRLQPARFDGIAGILLNNMHYQRNELVVLMILILFILAAVASAVTVAVWRVSTRRFAGSAFGLLLAAALVGCDDVAPGEPRPLDPVVVFGEPGRSLGQFVYPRAIDVDPQREIVYVVDRSGRIQRFALTGSPVDQWMLPEYDQGYPTGVTVAPDGRVFVADTHEHCVTVFSPEGEVLAQFGEFGMEPGEFQFPTDVAFGPDGRIYVAEYGGNDRIQVFDRDFRLLFQFGSFGPEPGQFNRPQGMAFNADRTELYVADSCNHRIQVFNPDGELLRILGSVGTDPGEFRYPYGVKLLEDGTVLVCEFGNSRLQKLTRTGEPLGMHGGPGKDPGRLASPWSTAETDGMLFVLDSRNSRVQVIDTP